jgi:hypothetical protein
MLWKRTKVMLIVFAVATFLALLIAAMPEAGRGPRPKLPALDKDAIAKIETTGGRATYTLTKSGDKWTVAPGDYPADGAQINRAVAALAALNLGAMVTDRASNHDKYEVGGSAMKLTAFTDKGAALRLTIGKETTDRRGAYIRLGDDDNVYIALTRLRELFDKDVNRWRDRSIVQFDKEKAVALTLRGPQETLSFKKGDDGAWAFDPPPANLPPDYRLDREKVTRLIGSLSNLQATDFDNATDVSIDRGLEPPLYVVSATLAGDQTIAVRLGAESEKDKKVYAQREGASQIYLLASYTMTSLRKSLDDLRDMHVATFDPEQAARLTIVEGARRLTLAKDGERWNVAQSTEAVADSFVLDPTKATGLIKSISSLQGVTFVGRAAPAGAGLNPPAGEVIVSLAGGGEKKVTVGGEGEKDQRYVAGDGYVYLARKAAVSHILAKLDYFKVAAARSPQQSGLDPAMLDKLPPQLREQFMQKQRQTIMQNQILQQMMKKSEKEKQPPAGGKK